MDTLGPTGWEVDKIIRYKGFHFSGYKGGHKNGLQMDSTKGYNRKIHEVHIHFYPPLRLVRVNILTNMDRSGICFGMCWIYGKQTMNFRQQCSLTSVLGYLQKVAGWLVVTGSWIVHQLYTPRTRGFPSVFPPYLSIIKHSTGKCPPTKWR